MSNPNYTLEIISHHPTFKNKSLRKYYVDGIETIGAWGDEPFEIRFKNNTWQKVQVRLSVDGTDVLTGNTASTEANGDMWMVNGYGTLSIKAWPETSHGGSHFVFTSANNSVAIHTHGDLSSRGIIAAAIYTEGHVPAYPPIVIDNRWTNRYRRSLTDYSTISGTFSGTTYSNNTLGGTNTQGSVTNSINLSDAGEVNTNYYSADATKSLESLVSVGAGQHVDQKISYVQGLIQPTLSETIRVRYLWWDDLVAKLREHNVPAPHASGFPGDKKQNIMSLGNTPKIGNFDQAFPRARPEPTPIHSYLRV